MVHPLVYILIMRKLVAQLKLKKTATYHLLYLYCTLRTGFKEYTIFQFFLQLYKTVFIV